jgi:hypothetical protein
MKYYLLSSSPRPDFRLLVTFSWSDGHDVDTDGDARNPASRDWTDFCCRERNAPFDRFQVEVVSGNRPHITVESPRQEIAARVALFLSDELTAEVVTSLVGNEALPRSTLAQACGPEFEVAAAFERTQLSRWRRATEDEPYPDPNGSSSTADPRG